MMYNMHDEVGFKYHNRMDDHLPKGGKHFLLGPGAGRVPGCPRMELV